MPKFGALAMKSHICNTVYDLLPKDTQCQKLSTAYFVAIFFQSMVMQSYQTLQIKLILLLRDTSNNHAGLPKYVIVSSTKSR